jgi:hypothetical protein
MTRWMMPLSWISLGVVCSSGCSSSSDQLSRLPLTRSTVAPTFLGGSSEHDLWAMGDLGPDANKLVHWNGSAWSIITPADHVTELHTALDGQFPTGITSAGPNALWLLNAGGAGHGVYKLSVDGSVEDHTPEFPATDGATRLVTSNGTNTYVLIASATGASTNLYGATTGAFALVAPLPGNPDALRVMPDGVVWVSRATDTMHPNPALLRLDGTSWTELATTGFGIEAFVTQAAFVAPDNLLVITTPPNDPLTPNTPPTAMILQHYDGTAVTAVTGGAGADFGNGTSNIVHTGITGTLPLANGAVGGLVIRQDGSNGSQHLEGDVIMVVWDGAHLSGDVQLAHLYDDCYATLCARPLLSGVLLDGTLVLTLQAPPSGLLVGKPHA